MKRLTRLTLLLVLGAAACGGPSGCSAGCQAEMTPEGVDVDASTGRPANPNLPGLGEGDPELEKELRSALQSKPDGYQPRTHHLEEDGSPEFTNRLILETSPYLLQHAHNPVNWFPWGDEAFERADEEDKPVLLSVGYSTCHWCHVMERESFEDLEIARFINEHFIPIKVDREERPDVDAIYMDAVRMLSGRGGWPMTVLLTPDREPFFGGTYFPARDGDRGAKKGFLTILREMHEEYREDHDEVVERAERLSKKLARASQRQRGAGVPGPAPLLRAVESIKRSFDPQWGGFGRAPKFPRPSTLEVLLRVQRRTGDEQALRAAVTTLEKMAQGGVYDQVGGGFHRYSTDRRWLVPHFEKMLYDNAQLVPLYLNAHQITGRKDFARIAEETLDYVEREMTSPNGGFYSATDADSMTPGGHREEGYFFTWTPDEMQKVLGPELARVAMTYYGVTPGGNFEGRSILHRPQPDAKVAATLGVSEEKLRERIAEADRLLLEARKKRPAPLRDEKILTAWNGLMISAFAQAGFALDRSDYLQRAERAANFIIEHMMNEDELRRSYKDGQAKQKGFLQDYAFFIQGLLDLYEASSSTRWLKTAIALQKTQDDSFWDEDEGGYFMISDQHEELLARQKPAYDGAQPSGNSVAALNSLRLHDLTHRPMYRERADSLLATFSSRLRSSPTSTAKMLSALEHSLDEPREVLVVTPEGDRKGESLVDAVRRQYLPNSVFTKSEQEAVSDRAQWVPGLEGKKALNDAPTAYVCKRGSCKQPARNAATLEAQLSDVLPLRD